MLSVAKDVKCAVKSWMSIMIGKNSVFTTNVINAGIRRCIVQKEVRYEVRYGRVCITPCYLIDNESGERPMIGSCKCQMCSNFQKVDRENKIVTCRSNPRPTFQTKPVKESRQDKFWAQQKIVECIETGKVYSSIVDASKAIGLSTTTIGQCAKNGRKTRLGYSFRFLG